MPFQNNGSRYPLLTRIALDILPAQASAVPCERVFSSSKETDTLRRANLAPSTMEALQSLKFLFKQDRLDFTSHFGATDAEFRLDPVDPDVVLRLLQERRFDELSELLGTGILPEATSAPIPFIFD